MSENEALQGSPVSPELPGYRRSVAVVTNTRYPNWYPGARKDIADTDKVRGDLALETIRNSLRMGYQTVVVDAESSHQFGEALSGTGANILRLDLPTGLSAERRLGFKTAVTLDGVKVVCMTEPEKVSFITDCLDRMVAPIIEGEADIVVGKRDPELHKRTYPDYQYESEAYANKKYNHILRLVGLRSKDDEELDMFFGPVAFRNSPEIVELFMRVYEFRGDRETGLGKYVDTERYADARHYPIINALYQGFRVVSVEVPFRYPDLQRQNEEVNPQRDRRKEQKFGHLVEEIALVRNLLDKKPKLIQKT